MIKLSCSQVLNWVTANLYRSHKFKPVHLRVGITLELVIDMIFDNKLLLLVLEGENTSSNVIHSNMTGWIAKRRVRWINYDLEEYPLQIRTDSAVGTGKKIFVDFYTAQEDVAGGVELYLTSPPRYVIKKCSGGWTKFPTDLPSEKDKIWTLTLTRVSDTRFTIHCNNKEVLSLTCSGSTTWSRDVEKTNFPSVDTATVAYRPGKEVRFSLLFT